MLELLYTPDPYQFEDQHCRLETPHRRAVLIRCGRAAFELL